MSQRTYHVQHEPRMNHELAISTGEAFLYGEYSDDISITDVSAFRREGGARNWTVTFTFDISPKEAPVVITIATPATTLAEWAAANPDAPLCISVGTKKETAAFLWALAAYGVPATVRVDATNAKVFHISVPASYLTAPVLWLATLREDAQTCSAPADGFKHVTVEVAR